MRIRVETGAAGGTGHRSGGEELTDELGQQEVVGDEKGVSSHEEAKLAGEAFQLGDVSGLGGRNWGRNQFR